jgi:hypothetical protein
MKGISVLVVNVLYEHHQIIEEVRKNYVQSKRYKKFNSNIINNLVYLIIQLNLIQILKRIWSSYNY